MATMTYTALKKAKNVADNKLRIAEKRIKELENENMILRRGMTGDYDLDSWLEFVAKTESVRDQCCCGETELSFKLCPVHSGKTG